VRQVRPFYNIFFFPFTKGGKHGGVGVLVNIIAFFSDCAIEVTEFCVMKSVFCDHFLCG